MSYEETTKTNSDIATELGVKALLRGSVRKDGNRIRISVQLINGKNDDHLWSESYDHDLDNIFEIQSNAAQNIASTLEAEVQPEVRVRIESKPTKALDAYDLYLKGNESYGASWASLEIGKVYKSIEYYEEAVEIDDKFSQAYTGLGRSYWMLAHFHKASLNKPDLWNKSREYLKKPLQLTLTTAGLWRVRAGCQQLALGQYRSQD